MTPIGELGGGKAIVSKVLLYLMKLRCSRCKRVFKSAGALATHERYSKRCGSMLAPTVQTAAPRVVPTPSAEKAISRGKKWDVGWSDVEKERYLLENSAFDWGIGRDRHGRWRVVPVPGGMSYSAAVIAADERNTIDRLMPVRRVRRVQEENTEEALSVLLMLELMNR